MKRGILALLLTGMLTICALAGTAWASDAAEPPPMDHSAYIRGRSEGVFAPNAPLTRAEAASMLDALLHTAGGEADTDAGFLDVPADAWFAVPVARLTAGGILGGYPDGSFRPQKPISRAEFVSVLVRCFPAAGGTADFADVPAGHWAEEAVAAASARGWVRGYDGGTFRPDRSITRAEAVTALNAALGRTPAAENLREYGIRPFADVRPEDWFYAAVTEASTVHEWDDPADGGGELWLGFAYPDSGLAPGLRQVGGSLYQVDEHGQILSLSAGFQILEGKTYCVAADGGIPFPGEGPFQLDGQLYCRHADGSLLLDEDYGVLHFDGSGRYTCGDAAMDAQVQALLAGCTDASMTRPQQLRAAYDCLRDNCRYLSRAHHPRGSTSWLMESANFWFAHHRGNCYCFAAVFHYLARQLGYQAVPVSGGVGPRDADHAWVMIDGRIYDPEYESQQWTVNQRRCDLFGVLPENAPFTYHFPAE